MSEALACIGGTAAYDLLSQGAFVGKRLGTRPTPFGESQPIYLCHTRKGDFYFLSRHGENGYDLAPSFVNYRANIYALKSLGVRAIVSWSETRAICHNYSIGEYVVVDDLIDETRCRANTFFENQGLGLIRQWPVFCPSLRQAFASTLEQEGGKFARSGTYVCVEGPRLETPAEVRKYASFGGDLIGTTLSPEVFLAKELQMCYASLCYVARYAETGSDFHPFEDGRVLTRAQQAERATRAVEHLPCLLERLCEALQSTPGQCRCDASMQHHIADGQIGMDWRTWFDDTVSPTPQHEPPARRVQRERSLA